MKTPERRLGPGTTILSSPRAWLAGKLARNRDLKGTMSEVN